MSTSAGNLGTGTLGAGNLYAGRCQYLRCQLQEYECESRHKQTTVRNGCYLFKI